MKKFALVLLLGILVLAGGCSKKKSTQPEPEPDYTLEASQTIGSEGDTLATSDFSLIVPAGAFGSDVTLKLYASSKDKPFGNNGVTRTFRLEGLPAEYSKPLPVHIKYQGTLSNESFIAAGKEAYVISADTEITSYNLLLATDSSGFLVGELPAQKVSKVIGWNNYHQIQRNGNQPSDVIEYWLGITNYRDYACLGGDFGIEYPSYLESAVPHLCEYLNAASDTFSAMGFEKEINIYLPLHATVLPIHFTSGFYKYRENKDDVNDVGKLFFDEDSLGVPAALPGIRVTAGREFFRFVLALYDSLIIPLPSTVSEYPTRFWLHEAIVSWSGEKFTEEASYIPPYFVEDNRAVPLLIGLNEMYGDPARVVAYGRGMSAVIKFLVDQYGQDFLVKMCKEMGPEKNPVDQIINGINEKEYVWWPGFFKEYVSGKIYGVKSDVFLNNKAGVFDIKSKSDTLKTFSGSYFDLSAKIYLINLNYPAIDSSAKIRFQLSAPHVNPDYMTILVFLLKDDTLSYLGQGNDLVIEQVRELTYQSSNLLAVVVNSSNESPYTGSSDIELEIKVVTVPEPSYDWNWCWIGYQVVGHIEDSYGDQYDDSTAGQGAGGSGSFSGNTFTASWDKTTSQYHSQGHLTVSINPATNTITSFSMVNTEQQLPPYAEVTYYDDLAGDNIPYESVSGGIILYEVSGADACNHITHLVHRWDMGSEWAEINTYDCGSQSTINVSFKKQ